MFFLRKKIVLPILRVDVDLRANDRRIMKGVVVGTTAKTTKIPATFGKEYVEVSSPKNGKNVINVCANSPNEMQVCLPISLKNKKHLFLNK